MRLTDSQVMRLTDDLVEEVCDLLGVDTDDGWEAVRDSLGPEIVLVLQDLRV